MLTFFQRKKINKFSFFFGEEPIETNQRSPQATPFPGGKYMRHVTVVAFALAAVFGCEKSVCEDDPGHAACQQPGDGEPLPALEAGAITDGATADAAPDGAEAGTSDAGNGDATNPGDTASGDSQPAGDGTIPADARPGIDQGHTPPPDVGPEQDARPPMHDAAPPDHDAARPPLDAAEPVDAAEPRCPSGNGFYCGGQDSPHPDWLYRCTDGDYVLAEECDVGCQRNPPGVDDACLPGTPFKVVFTPPGPNNDLDMTRMHLACTSSQGAPLVGDRQGDPIEVDAVNVNDEQLVFFGLIPEGEGLARCLVNVYDLVRDVWVVRCVGDFSPACELTQEGHFELAIGDAAPARCDSTTPNNGVHWAQCWPGGIPPPGE